MYSPSNAALNRHMPYHKGDEKTPTIELEESDTEDQGIDEEQTGEAEQMCLYLKIYLAFSNLSLRVLSSFYVAF